MPTGLDQYVLRSVSDWRFYFQHAKAEMGIKAIDYENMAVRCANGTVYVVEPLEQQQAAARKHARIEAALQWMPTEDVRVIRLTCDDDPRETWEPFYPAGLGNVAHLTPAAQLAHQRSRSTKSIGEWLDRLGQKIAKGRAIMEDRIVRERIKTGIEGLISTTHESYQRARGKFR